MKVVQFRRKQEGKTDYPKRIRLLTGQQPRLIVRPALKNITAQVATYDSVGDRIVAGVNSRALEKYGWTVHKGNIPAAYLTGYLLGKRTIKQKVKEAVLDTGMHTPIKGSKIYACVKGMLDAGVQIPADKKVLPSDDRIKGQHIAEYAKNSKKQMTDYTKAGIDPVVIVKLFEKVKAAIEAKP